uniref:Gustatory receptor n=1 Tax=Strigamia maritima TaxID=126957 RepID=T1JK10_STRMM
MSKRFNFQNFFSTKSTLSTISKLPTHTLYADRLKFIWKSAFLAYGFDVYSYTVSRRKEVVMCAMTIIQLIILLHHTISIIYTIAVELSISKVSFYATLIVSSFTSVCNLWAMYRMRFGLAKLLHNAIDHLKDNTQCLKKLWLWSLIGCGCLSIMSFIEMLCGVVDVLTQDNIVIYNYTCVYLFGLKLAEEDLYIARGIIAFEFFVILLLTGVFVNISVSFFIHLCHMLFYQFKQLNENFLRVLKSGKPLSCCDLTEFRKKHQHACETADELSRFWSPLIVIWLLGFILSLCFDLRALWLKNSPLFMVGFTIDFVRQLWLLVSLFKVASLVNVEAHKLAEVLVTFSMDKPIGVNNNSDQMLYYVNYMLLSDRLANTRIGINASGLFLLNASSFISMAGTVLTYVIVLYQSP